MRPQHVPDPCTEEARDEGCTCTMEHSHSASIDPPEPIIDRYCPVHAGYDADQAMEQARDDARDFPPQMFDEED